MKHARIFGIGFALDLAGEKDADDLEWMPVAQARAQVKRWSIHQLNAAWFRWKAAKVSIDEAWHKDAEARLAAATASIDADRRVMEIEQEYERRLEWHRADQIETQKWVDALAAAIKREKDEWLAKAKARLARAQASINIDTCRAERKELLRRGVVRGRRNTHRVK